MELPSQALHCSLVSKSHAAAATAAEAARLAAAQTEAAQHSSLTSRRSVPVKAARGSGAPKDSSFNSKFTKTRKVLDYSFFRSEKNKILICCPCAKHESAAVVTVQRLETSPVFSFAYHPFLW